MVSYLQLRRFDWLPLWLEKASESKKHIDTARHELLLGKSFSGKTFLEKFLAGYEVTAGYAKFVQVNLKKKEALREFLAFGSGNDYPSGREGRKLDLMQSYSNGEANKKNKLVPQFKDPIPIDWQKRVLSGEIKTKVYVPLTRNCPNKLPANFVPFTIPVTHLTEKEIGEAIIPVLYAGKEYSSGYSALQDACSNFNADSSFPDLWDKLKDLKDASYFTSQRSFKGYGGLNFPSIGDTTNPQTLSSVINRFKPFAELGLFSSAKFPYALPNLLRDELKQQKTIVGVYTGFLKDPLQQLFCEIYFTQCCNYLLSEEGLGREINYAIKLFWEDAGDEFKSTKSKLFKDSDTASASFFIKMLTRIRHAGIVISLSIQSPKMFEDAQFTNFAWHFFTGSDMGADQEWIAEQLKVSAGEVGEIFNKWSYQQIGRTQNTRVYKFALKQLGIPSYREGKRVEYGFELPHIPASSTQKIRDFRDWAELARNTGEPLTNAFTLARKLLIAEYSPKIKANAIKNKKREELKHKLENETMRDKANQINNAAAVANKTRSIRQVAARLGIQRETAANYIRQAAQLGLLNSKTEEYFRTETKIFKQQTLDNEEANNE